VRVSLAKGPRANGYRARRELNNDTIRELHKAFRRGGAQAINKVMRNNPAMFLKLLVLLVPREMQIEHSGGIKAMTTEQIERSIELIKEMLAEREDGSNAKVIEGTVEKPRKRGPRPGALAGRVLDNARRTRKPRTDGEGRGQGDAATD
jgi:hypothetical protein